MAIFSRRRFLQGAIGVGAAVGAHSVLGRLVLGAASQPATAPRNVVHPNIDDLRVVGLADPRMTTAQEVRSNWAKQEQLVNSKAVGENIHRLACTLSQEKDEAKAWKAIFVKPPKKSWQETVVAIKTNNIAQQHTHSALMKTVCQALTDVLGVKPGNIHIYDACHGGDMTRKTPFRELPEGVRVEGKWGGSKVNVPVGKPYTGKQSACVKPLTDGAVDILINIAMCKGHSDAFGRFTMTMKNHLGTFSPRPAHKEGMDYVVAINRTPQILGATDPDSGKVLYPRQQLCLVDALWASETGPGGLPTAQPNFLAMGVFAPAVDYLIATEFRARKMGWKVNDEPLESMLKHFDLPKSDLKDIVPVEV